MEAPSFVSKARTAFHSAAAKAERVFTDIKSDFNFVGSQVSAIVEKLYSTNPDTIPPTSVLKQLAIAIDAGKKYKSMKDILASSGGSSPIMERASLSLAAVKSLVLREKEDKLASEFGGDDEKVLSLIRSLFDVEGEFLRRNISSGLEALSLPKDIHGAPPESLLVKLSEAIGSFKTLRKMAFIWCKIVAEEGPLLTEDLIRENEEFVLRTGRFGAFSYSSIMKWIIVILLIKFLGHAANPGCILEDFVRWHSPPDWTDILDEANEFSEGGDASSTRGQLSRRMQKEGNLWRELWETAKAVPAIKQAPLFDEIWQRFVMAESKLSSNNDLSKLFNECKDYIVFTKQGSSWSEKVDDLCQVGYLNLEVYETVEKILLNPEEVLKAVKHTEETTSTTAGEPKSRFKRLGLNFGSKDRNLRKPSIKDEKNSEISTRQPFSNFFDGKSSLFSKKPPKPESASAVLQGSASDLCTLAVWIGLNHGKIACSDVVLGLLMVYFKILKLGYIDIEKVKRTIFVDNLSPQVTETVLAKALNQFGTVVSASLIPNYLEPRNILCALVEMEDSEKAKKVISSITEFPFLIAGMPRPVRACFAEVEMFDDRPVKPGRRVRCSWLDPSNPDFEVAKKLKRLTRKHAAEASFCTREEKLHKQQVENLKANFKKYEMIVGVLSDKTLQSLAGHYGMRVSDDL
ncbi:hypothetical protein GH714_023924 [Hevea brasiliensis]|uniref:RRM domain-containing protein n=1 Tax=Hevea brasiliensis TaxID=3981 RepID=A0A6A6MPG6_HEVBR|nr:hypothetical protein GH714_023924 [Hevea brasiliensis]